MTRKKIIIHVGALVAVLLIGGTVAAATAKGGFGCHNGYGSLDADWAVKAEETLAITPDQQAAWSLYADSLLAQAKAKEDRRGGMDRDAFRESMRELSDADRMTKMQAMKADALTQMAATAQAKSALFEVLTDEQKLQAREVLPHGHRGKHWGYGR